MELFRAGCWQLGKEYQRRIGEGETKSKNSTVGRATVGVSERRQSTTISKGVNHAEQPKERVQDIWKISKNISTSIKQKKKRREKRVEGPILTSWNKFGERGSTGGRPEGGKKFHQIAGEIRTGLFMVGEKSKILNNV